jgi:hypothetical protein
MTAKQALFRIFFVICLAVLIEKCLFAAQNIIEKCSFWVSKLIEKCSFWPSKLIEKCKNVMLYRKITSYIEDYLKSDNDKILILNSLNYERERSAKRL